MRFISLTLILLSVFVAGCSVNPVTGEKELSFLSPAQEVQIGTNNYKPYQQQQGGAYVVDPDLTPYVREVGLSIAQLSDRPNLPYDFVVLNSSVPNAWALPGGKIAINRGLLVLLEDEAQLAAVLAHEVVHAAARHAAQQITQKQIMGVGVALAGIAASQHEHGQYIGLGLMGGAALYQAHYGRTQELEADRFGIEYMVRAGYEPRAAVELQKTFVALSKGKNTDIFRALFASHPPSQQRVDKNRELSKNLPSGKRNRERYQRAIAQIKKDEAAYKKHSEALEAMSKKDSEKAKNLLNQAINLQPNEAIFYTTTGQIFFQEKQFRQARNYFESAFKINPDYFMSSLGLGLSQKSLGASAIAKQNLEKSVAILPTPVAVYHLGELAEQAGDRAKAIQYYRQVASSGGTYGQAASTRLGQMGVAPQTP